MTEGKILDPDDDCPKCDKPLNRNRHIVVFTFQEEKGLRYECSECFCIHYLQAVNDGNPLPHIVKWL